VFYAFYFYHFVIIAVTVVIVCILPNVSHGGSGADVLSVDQSHPARLEQITRQNTLSAYIFKKLIFFEWVLIK
jgi:hypothetical protein